MTRDDLLGHLRCMASLKLFADYEDVANEAADTIESLQQRCAEHGEARLKLAEQIVEDGKRIAALEAALEEALPLLEGYTREYGPTPASDEPRILANLQALTSSEGAENG